MHLIYSTLISETDIYNWKTNLVIIHTKKIIQIYDIINIPNIKFSLKTLFKNKDYVITKKDLKVIGWGAMDWINLAQDKYYWLVLVSTIMTLRVQNILGSGWATISFLYTQLHGFS
jgi:hypothetical protein